MAYYSYDPEVMESTTWMLDTSWSVQQAQVLDIGCMELFFIASWQPTDALHFSEPQLSRQNLLQPFSDPKYAQSIKVGPEKNNQA